MTKKEIEDKDYMEAVKKMQKAVMYEEIAKIEVERDLENQS